MRASRLTSQPRDLCEISGVSRGCTLSEEVLNVDRTPE
jgi:hypothetical protein